MVENDTTKGEPRTSGMNDPDYRNERRKKKKPFNFEIEPERREELRQVAKKRCASMGAAIRQLISAAYDMEIKGNPKCVTGRQCFVPHMQPPQGKSDAP